MTVIVRNVKYKKDLIAHPEKATFFDPSRFSPLFDGTNFTIGYLENGTSFNCTNCPHRTWFATVKMTKDGLEIT